MEKKTPKNQSEEEKEVEKKIQEDEWEEWEMAEETNSEADVTAKEPSKPTSAIPPQKTDIVKPKKDRNKCPKCGSEIVFYFEKEDLYWCHSCREAYRFEEDD